MRNRFLQSRLVAVAMAVVLSGCLGGGGENAPEAASGDVATDESLGVGGIGVLVITPEFEPIRGAQVLLADLDVSVTTGADGRANFTALAPGDYTVVAGKPGYTPSQERGKVVAVVADAQAEVTLELVPIPVVTAEQAYHETLIFNGFISCSVETIRVAVLANRSQCGKGVAVGGMNYGADPNENASHPWEVENRQIESIVIEAQWEPTVDALGNQLYFATQSAYTCYAASCQYSNEIGGVGGSSPLYKVIHDGVGEEIVGHLEEDPEKYPVVLWTAGRTYCPDGCYVTASFQQRYDLWVSAFYGQAADDDWRALPQ